MKAKSLTYKRAIEELLKHKELIGNAFSNNDPARGKIARMLIAPYDRILQWQFLSSVYAGTDPEQALSICRDGKYEVLLVSSKYRPDELDHRPKTLREFLQERSSAPDEGPADDLASSRPDNSRG